MGGEEEFVRTRGISRGKHNVVHACHACLQLQWCLLGRWGRWHQKKNIPWGGIGEVGMRYGRLMPGARINMGWRSHELTCGEASSSLAVATTAPSARQPSSISHSFFAATAKNSRHSSCNAGARIETHTRAHVSTAVKPRMHAHTPAASPSAPLAPECACALAGIAAGRSCPAPCRQRQRRRQRRYR